MKLFRAAPLFLSIVSIAAPALAQSNKCLDRMLSLNINSRDGSPLLGLSANSFAASVQGKTMKINSVTLDHNPRRILLLIDVSGSFLRVSDWATDTTLDLIEHIPPPNQIGLATFSESVNLLVPPTTDRIELRDKLHSISQPSSAHLPPYRGRTALWDAIEDGVKLMDSHQIGDVIFLITDGMDNRSKANSSDATRSLLDRGMRLFTLQVIDPHIGAPFVHLNDDAYLILSKVAVETGGLALVPQPGSSDPPDKGRIPLWLRHDLDVQYRQILDFFRIDVTLPQPLDKQERWKLSVTVPNRSAKDFELNYPRSMLPCS